MHTHCMFLLQWSIIDLIVLLQIDMSGWHPTCALALFREIISLCACALIERIAAFGVR